MVSGLPSWPVGRVRYQYPRLITSPGMLALPRGGRRGGAEGRPGDRRRGARGRGEAPGVVARVAVPTVLPVTSVRLAAPRVSVSSGRLGCAPVVTLPVAEWSGVAPVPAVLGQDAAPRTRAGGGGAARSSCRSTSRTSCWRTRTSAGVVGVVASRRTQEPEREPLSSSSSFSSSFFASSRSSSSAASVGVGAGGAGRGGWSRYPAPGRAAGTTGRRCRGRPSAAAPRGRAAGRRCRRCPSSPPGSSRCPRSAADAEPLVPEPLVPEPVVAEPVVAEPAAEPPDVDAPAGEEPAGEVEAGPIRRSPPPAR